MSEEKQKIDKRIQFLQNEINSNRNDGYTEKGMKEELEKLLKSKIKITYIKEDFPDGVHRY
jgi:hypothetical protein